MRENRTHGSEGGGTRNSTGPPYPYPSFGLIAFQRTSAMPSGEDGPDVLGALPPTPQDVSLYGQQQHNKHRGATITSDGRPCCCAAAEVLGSLPRVALSPWAACSLDRRARTSSSCCGPQCDKSQGVWGTGPPGRFSRKYPQMRRAGISLFPLPRSACPGFHEAARHGDLPLLLCAVC